MRARCARACEVAKWGGSRERAAAERDLAFSAFAMPRYFFTMSWENVATLSFSGAVALVSAPLSFANPFRAASSAFTALSCSGTFTPAAAAVPAAAADR